MRKSTWALLNSQKKWERNSDSRTGRVEVEICREYMCMVFWEWNEHNQSRAWQVDLIRRALLVRITSKITFYSCVHFGWLTNLQWVGDIQQNRFYKCSFNGYKERAHLRERAKRVAWRALFVDASGLILYLRETESFGTESSVPYLREHALQDAITSRWIRVVNWADLIVALVLWRRELFPWDPK